MVGNPKTIRIIPKFQDAAFIYEHLGPISTYVLVYL